MAYTVGRVGVAEYNLDSGSTHMDFLNFVACVFDFGRGKLFRRRLDMGWHFDCFFALLNDGYIVLLLNLVVTSLEYLACDH